jgi:hypothetical protein
MALESCRGLRQDREPIDCPLVVAGVEYLHVANPIGFHDREDQAVQLVPTTSISDVTAHGHAEQHHPLVLAQPRLDRKFSVW